VDLRSQSDLPSLQKMLNAAPQNIFLQKYASRVKMHIAALRHLYF
jgi:hypothetical protein